MFQEVHLLFAWDHDLASTTCIGWNQNNKNDILKLWRLCMLLYWVADQSICPCSTTYSDGQRTLLVRGMSKVSKCGCIRQTNVVDTRQRSEKSNNFVSLVCVLPHTRPLPAKISQGSFLKNLPKAWAFSSPHSFLCIADMHPFIFW